MSMSVSIIDLYSASPRKPLMHFISFYLITYVAWSCWGKSRL